MRMEKFEYSYLEGPVVRSDLILGKKMGNCRFAVQDFYYKYFGKFLRPEEILLPGAYRDVGEFVFCEVFDSAQTLREKIDFNKLRVGDIIYAKKRFDSKGNDILKKKEDYIPSSLKKLRRTQEDEWILYSHSAVFLGEVNEKLEEMFGDYQLEKDKLLIWHATGYVGESCVWEVGEFVEKYEVMAAKRLGLTK
jgi:hypothetical protein